MVTKIKPVDKVIEELKSRDISKQDVSANITESINTRQSTYIPARIKADGKINRKILGTVSGNELVAEKNNLMNILSPVSEGYDKTTDCRTNTRPPSRFYAKYSYSK